MAKKKKTDRRGVVFSTNPDYNYTDGEGDMEDSALPTAEQRLRILLDLKHRKGKEVTLVTGFDGPDEDLKGLGKMLTSQ